MLIRYAAEDATMTGGIDRGFCLLYWRLSYRRKFLRTVWLSVLGLPVLVFFQLTGLSNEPLQLLAGRYAYWLGWGLIGALAAIGVLQAWYTWLRWRRELNTAA